MEVAYSTDNLSIEIKPTCVSNIDDPSMQEQTEEDYRKIWAAAETDRVINDMIRRAQSGVNQLNKIINNQIADNEQAGRKGYFHVGW